MGKRAKRGKARTRGAQNISWARLSYRRGPWWTRALGADSIPCMRRPSARYLIWWPTPAKRIGAPLEVVSSVGLRSPRAVERVLVSVGRGELLFVPEIETRYESTLLLGYLEVVVGGFPSSYPPFGKSAPLSVRVWCRGPLRGPCAAGRGCDLPPSPSAASRTNTHRLCYAADSRHTCARIVYLYELAYRNILHKRVPRQPSLAQWRGAHYVQGTLCPSSVNTPQSSPWLKHVPARKRKREFPLHVRDALAHRW